MSAYTTATLRRRLVNNWTKTQARVYRPTLRHASITTTTTPTSKTSKFAAYTTRLNALSARTGVSLPSLALSFGILHELSAIIPLLVLFFGFQAANVGATIVQWAGQVTEESEHDHGNLNWRVTVRDWLAEGERRVDKVARRYGLFGYEKGQKAVLLEEGGGVHAEEEAKQLARAAKGSKAAADVTNAVAAYVLVKALLPARIGVSLAFAPAFSRGVIDPTRRFVWHGMLRRPRKPN
ncbi:hypothetical protein QFC24_002082 [Naganishia onofrii]|uniref:Uncharacterized protein n=1 Tax=Naganishia onofrii TaxID=1851511 RepID=A0ACC2XRV6_9TREE|nr:hypothetical protein QFC24_002082 [Naganishia onofrii]